MAECQAPDTSASREEPLEIGLRISSRSHGEHRIRLSTDGTTIEAGAVDDLDRLTGLGATRIDIGQGDVSWVVMADPDNNEFCVLSPR